MKYNRFEELPVWKAAIEFGVRVYALTVNPRFRGFYSLKDQLERAAVSISNNIAEGFERGTTPELLTFIYIARGSSGECRSVLCLIERLSAFADLKFEISDLKSTAEAISRQLRAWANSLQNSDIRGQRYLNERSKKAAGLKAEREELRKELEAAQLRNIQNARNRGSNDSES
ncbi:MAG: four helix bundle protein [Pyrinomonadaceae bacterium]